MAKQAQKAEERKSYAGIMLVTVLALVASMFLVREFVFAPQVEIVATMPVDKVDPVTGETIATNPPAPITDATPVPDATPQPVAPAETPKAESVAPAPAEPAANPKPTGTEISFKEAKFYELSVGSAANRDGFTVVFTDRGGVLSVVRFIDGPRATGKPTFTRTPADPAIAPNEDDPEQTLLLLGPSESVASWRYDAGIQGYLPLDHDAPEQTAFPDQIPPTDASFGRFWRDNAEFPYGFSGTMASANSLKWMTDGVVDEGTHKRITFTLPGGDAGVTLSKTFRVYPGFKIACDVTATAGAGAEAQNVTFALNGPSGIREDLFKAERAGVTTLFEAGQGLVYEHHEHMFGEPLLSRFNDYREELAEQGRPVPGNVLPIHQLYENDSNHRVFLHGLSTGYFLAVMGLDALPAAGEVPGAAVRFPYHPTEKSLLMVPLGSIVQTTFSLPAQRLEPGATITRRVVMYTGPQDKPVVEAAFAVGNPIVVDGVVKNKSSWDEMVPNGWPAFISAPITWILNWLTSITGMAGLAIIFLVIIVRVVISPLSIKAQITMQVHGDKMRKIKPKLDAIKEKYKDQKGRDSQLLAFQETRAVMKSNNVSMFPLGGCLILLLQMPIFIALYNTVRTSFALRHEEFLWMSDLARPDNIIGAAWQTSWPIIGANGFATLNLLPILWSVLLIVQQRMQTKPTDEQQARMQKQMAIIMPLMGLFFYAMPSGFTLYFVVSSVYSFFESRTVKWWLVKTGRIEAGGGMAMAPM